VDERRPEVKAFYVMFVVFAVLLLAAPLASAQEGWPGCPWGAAYDPMAHGYVPACFSRPAAPESSAPKPAGLAQLAPVEEFAPCGFSEQLDPLLDPLALACLSQPATPEKAASKPAGLAAPAPAAIPEQVLSCQMWGDAAHNAWSDADYNPMLYGYVPECVSRPAANAGASKPSGLAAPAPAQEQFGPCGSSGESPDPLAWPLACLR
jgi:hypothetical protein